MTRTPRKRDFLTIGDMSEAELHEILEKASRMKRSAGRSHALAGRTVALVFQKPSMRTRVAFEVAVLQLGGSVVSLGQEDIQLGKREPIRDVARVLSRYVDAIVVRTFAHADTEEFAKYSRGPVINGLSDSAHPCQALADLLTMQEHFGTLRGLTVAYVGDGNNVLHSLLEGCALLGVNVSVSTPRLYRPDAEIWKRTVRWAGARGASLQWEAKPARAVRGADVIYTDVWVSMGQERERARRLKAFKAYQLNLSLVAGAKPHCQVMHCLPAHRGEEIVDEVMEGSQSLIFEQAENRLYVHKAVLAFLLDDRRKR